jgi:stearoyl-CoA desaturase (delta-9 desaturase)
MISKFLDPDKLFHNYFGMKVKLLILISLVINAIWLIYDDVSLLGFLFCFYFAVLYLRTGVEAGFHRYFAHRSYETTHLKSRFLLLLGSSIGVGSCLGWVGVHRIHHRYSDKKEDPHSPHNIGIVRVWATMWDNNWIVPPATVKDLFKDKWQLFLHKNYFKVLLSWMAFLSAVSYFVGSAMPIILLFSLPCSLTFLLSGITNGLGHTRGYKNFESNDHSHNQNWPRWMLLTAGLHNNHHAYPNVWDYNVRQKYHEFDIEGFIIKYFFIKK